MKHRIMGATALAVLGIATPASATGSPSATINIATDKAACKATVTVEWKGKSGYPAGTQVNVDNLGRQDDAKQLSDPGGHTLVKAPSLHTYTFTLAKNAAHVIDAWTVLGAAKVREVAYLDCTTPVPPKVVEVQTPGPVVEVLVPQLGPERIVEVPKLVTRTAIKYRTRIRYRTRYKTRTIRVCPRPSAKKFAG